MSIETADRSLPLPTAMPAHPPVLLLKGREAILSMRGALSRFAEMCDQPGSMVDLPFFLSKPGLLKRAPRLMLIFREDRPPKSEITADHLLGALLLHEYQLAGYGTGVFTTNDRSGRNTLVAPATLRSRIAEFAASALLDRKAHVVMISFRDKVSVEEGSSSPLSPVRSFTGSRSARWIRREREIAEYLPLESTYEGTLAKINAKTRSNMRYYRRRAAKELGCTFVPDVQMSRKEMVSFGRECMYAVPDKIAGWRYDVLKELSTPLFMGLRDKEGRWLSVVGGRRFNSSSEILWQLNRSGLPLYSISLLMRSHFMEHEIAAGSRRFYIEGGSSHPILHSFVTGRLVDLAVLRRSPAALLTRKLARHIVPGDNELAQLFSGSEEQWRSPRGIPVPGDAR